MAKMTLGQISNPSFTAGMQLLLTKELKAKTAYKLKGLVEKFNAELKKFGELRKEICERYCKKSEDGSPVLDDKKNYTFEPDKLEALQKDITELTGIEVEFSPITLDELGDISLTAQQLFDLGDIIDAT